MTPHSNLHVNADRLWESLHQSAKIGPGVAGGLRRLALSDEDKAARDQFALWCQELGLTMTIDAAGNMFARLEGEKDLPPVVMGSHLDTQQAGGRFDGILGVLGGLEVLRSIKDAGLTPKRPIELVNWSNEEGARFAPSMAASSVFAGAKSLDWLYARTDDDGRTFGEELERIGYKGDAPVGGRELDAYFELHIEQGPRLDEAGLSVGVVTAPYYAIGTRVIFKGETAHSGPTDMIRRKNALVGAGYFITAIDEIGWEVAPAGKACVSRLVASPNKNGILPDQAELIFDCRHPEKAVAEDMYRKALNALEHSARRANLDYEILERWTFGDEVFDPDCIQLVRDSAKSLGLETLDLYSQAGHDAFFLAGMTPTAMIFSSCINGITHNEAEDVSYQDAVDATNVLLHTALARANR